MYRLLAQPLYLYFVRVRSLRYGSFTSFRTTKEYSPIIQHSHVILASPVVLASHVILSAAKDPRGKITDYKHLLSQITESESVKYDCRKEEKTPRRGSNAPRSNSGICATRKEHLNLRFPSSQLLRPSEIQVFSSRNSANPSSDSRI